MKHNSTDRSVDAGPGNRKQRRAAKNAAGVMALMVAAAAFGIPSGTPSTSAAAPSIEGSSTALFSETDLALVTNYVSDVVIDADEMWSSWITGRGYPEPYVQYDIIQPGQPRSYNTDCAFPDPRNGGVPTATYDSQFPNAFYCPVADNALGGKGVLILPVEALAHLWTGNVFGRSSTQSGDFAVATVVAHEFGHHVAQQLANNTGGSLAAGKNNELLADCFAGVYTNHVHGEGALEQGDIDEGLAALEQLGDPPTTDGSAPLFPHGTAEEREAAFKIGIYGTSGDSRGGVPGNCISTYWPSYTGSK